MPAACEMLTYLNDAGFLTRKQFEQCLDFAYRSGQAYFTDRILDAQQLRRLFVHPPAGSNQQMIQIGILNFLTQGTSWRFFQFTDPVTSDEDLDTRQVFDQTAKALTCTADALVAHRTADRKGLGRLDKEDITVITAQLDLATKRIEQSRRAVALLAHTAQATAAA